MSSGNRSGGPKSSKVSITRITNNKVFEELAMKPTTASGAELLSTLEITDHGPQNLIEGNRSLHISADRHDML